MNPYAKYLAGGALLATTALVSGNVHAASLIGGSAIATNGVPDAAFTAVSVANTAVSGTKGSSTILGPLSFGIKSSASSAYASASTVSLTFTGATLAGTVDVTGAAVANGTYTGLGGSAGATAVLFSDHINISVSGTWSVLIVSGVQFTEAQSLATVGNTISVSGTVSQTSFGQTESIASTTLVKSVAGPAAVITAGDTVKASSASTPPFVNFSGNSTPATLTAILGTISISDAAGVSIDLKGAVSTSNFVTTSEIKISHPVLANAAATDLYLGTNHETVSQFSSGTATFTILPSSLATSANVLTVQVVFDGSTQISGGKGGTATVTFLAGNTDAFGTASKGFGKIAATTGNLADVLQGGLSAEVNTAQASTNAFQSFIRIHNTSSQAGVATIVVKNDATGATLGTYTSVSIAGGATLQIGTGDIESQLNITPDATIPYTLDITGAFNGYVQHLAFDGHSVVDLSAFRNGGSTNGTP